MAVHRQTQIARAALLGHSGRRRQLALVGAIVAVSILGVQASSTRTLAASAQASMNVSVKVNENCVALVTSTTTIINSSFTCAPFPSSGGFSPTVTTTSLAILAPNALTAGAKPGAAGSSVGAGVGLNPDGSITVAWISGQFTQSFDDGDQVVTVTY